MVEAIDEMTESLVQKRLRYIERQRALRGATPEAFAHSQPSGSGPANRHGMPKLPVGQHQVKNWPVLDLGDVPAISQAEWRLEVGGLCDNPLTLDWSQFMALPQVDDVSDFHCVTTWSRMDNRWGGVRFRTLAELAVPAEEARFVLCTGGDHMPGTRIPYTVNLPLARAVEEDVLLVHTWEGQPLPREPARRAWAESLQAPGLGRRSASPDEARPRFARTSSAPRHFHQAQLLEAPFLRKNVDRSKE